MTTQKPDTSDLNALAIEVCDLWQEHLSTLASDPGARAELTRFLEPQRKLFADWAAMTQPGAAHEPQRAQAEPAPQQPPAPEAAPASGGATHVDDPLRVAQLALRLAELERRVAQLEARPASAARRTQSPVS